MSVAVEFRNVSKRFTLHHDRPGALREVFFHLLHGQWHQPSETLWALRDIDFTVEEGTTLGLIGPNGSGKSTALKLAGGILEPTQGEVRANGRVAALIELGAGFHPELTGRENVYLNGAILGLSRRELERKFDDIVAFSELERFIDMPVKHYSAGMYMRLGFAVAINVDPDILLTDEILAVGDQSFQAKCMERIGQVKRSGVTILFVSHNLDAVRSLCSKSVWLDGGRVAASGPTDQVISAYLASVAVKEETRLAAQQTQEREEDHWGSGEATILDVRFLDAYGRERHVFFSDEPMRARVRYQAQRRIEKPVFGVAIYRSDGIHVNGPNTRFSGYDIDCIEGEGEIDYVVESLALLEGSYDFSAAIYDYECVHPYDHQHRTYKFLVQRGAVSESYGLVYMPSHWEHRRL